MKYFVSVLTNAILKTKGVWGIWLNNDLLSMYMRNCCVRFGYYKNLWKYVKRKHTFK